MKLKSMVIMAKPRAMEVTSKQGKAVPRFTEVTLTTKQFPELKDYAEEGKKCSLAFSGEVSGFRSADEWQIREGNLAKGDISVTIKLLKGSIEGEGEKDEKNEKPKNIAQAGHMMRDDMMAKHK